MNIQLNDFFLSTDQLSIIKKWRTNYNKPLIINGSMGIGKTTLSNILLSDYNIIEYNSSLDIKECFYKADIFMMVNPEYIKKAFLIDDMIIHYKNIIKNKDIIFGLKSIPTIIVIHEENYKIKSYICLLFVCKGFRGN